MTRTTLFIKYSTVATLLCAIWGCGTSNDQAPSLNSSGQHPADWYTGHRIAYSRAVAIDNASQCRECHGMDLKGGITKVDCFTGVPGGRCHSDNHEPRPIPHNIPFTDPASHGPAAKADLVYCQGCHGQLGGPGKNPRFNLSIGPFATGCSSNGCHNKATPAQFRYTSAAHPIPWNGHATAGNLNNACTLCHGVIFNGGVGRACSSCHTNLSVGAIPVAGQCSSCHGKGPNGSGFPNISGSHRIHTSALTSFPDSCSICHNGAGSGSSQHSTLSRATVAFAASISSKSGTASYNQSSLSCSGTICHGGLTTPPWRGGKIDNTSQCVYCHTAGTAAQTPQYNSYWSGQHDRHVRIFGMLCNDCHDMSRTDTSTGASHFSGLGTPVFELNPVLTIKPGLNYAGGSCNPGRSPTGFSLGVCHTSETW